MYLNEKYKGIFEKNCITTLPPTMTSSFISSLITSIYLYPGDTSQGQANNIQGILCLEKGYLFVGKS
jgi:hypothetical protein